MSAGSATTLEARTVIRSAKADLMLGSTPMTDFWGQDCSCPDSQATQTPHASTGLTVTAAPTARSGRSWTFAPSRATRATVS